jgi:hypothetical protein
MSLIAATENEKIEWMQFHLHKFGWQGGFGLLLLLGAAWLLLAFVLPKTNEIANLNSEMHKLRTTPAKLAQTDDKKERLDMAQRFYALLPLEDEANIKVAEILDAAKLEGLVANKSEYRLQKMPASAISSYQINLPVLGSYIQIRQFIKHVLNAHPSLALNAINLKRDDVNNEAVEANIQLTLYLKRAKS